MAGMAEFVVRVLDRVGNVLMELPPQRIVLHDGPAIIAPGTLARGDLGNVFAFELTSSGHRLGLLPLAPVPTASFDGGWASRRRAWTFRGRRRRRSSCTIDSGNCSGKVEGKPDLP